MKATRVGLLAAGSIGLLAALTGCSSYPDPYRDSCPAVERLRLEAIGPTGATFRWQTTRLSPTRLRLRPEAGGLEELSEDLDEKADHEVTVSRLVPDTRYQFTIETANERGACPGETTTGSFATLPVNPPAGPTPTPVPDPTVPVTP